MAHDINQMVYAGATPWHGLGTKLPANGTWDEIRAAAGFYNAVERPLYLPGGALVPDKKALVRHDTGAYISTVGKDYKVVQFNELAEAGVIAAGNVDAIWHTAGTLGENAATGWLLAELPNPIRVAFDRSEIRKYVLLYTGHDGYTATYFKNCATRAVCRNTIGAALRESEGAVWAIRHTANASDRLKQAAIAFRNMSTNMDKFGQLANVLARVRFTEAQHRETIDAVLPVPQDGKKHPKTERMRAEVGALYDTFIGREGIAGTAWGSFQAWTEFVDHHRLAGSQAWAKRVENVTLGSGAAMKADALEAIVERAGITADKAREVLAAV